MGLEAFTFITSLNSSNPVGATDKKQQGDDHLRGIKTVLLASFPNISGAVTSSHTELNRLTGVTGVTGSGKLVLDTSPTISGTLTAGTFSGSGASLTAVPAASLTGSHTLPDGTLSTNV